MTIGRTAGVAGAAAGAASLAAWHCAVLVRGLGALQAGDLPGLVELAVTAAAGLVATWWAGGAGVVTACLVARRLGRRWRSGEVWAVRLAPALLRRVLTGVVAAGLGLGGIGPALAADPSPGPAASATAIGLDLGWPVTSTTGPAGSPSTAAGATIPVASPGSGASTGPAPAGSAATSTAPTGAVATPPPSSAVPGTSTAQGSGVSATAAPAPVPAPAAPAPPDAAVPDTVVVEPGDTLWQIARQHLQPGAGDADVARAWPAWYQGNRDVIGPDPDLLLPGEQLRMPGGGA